MLEKFIDKYLKMKNNFMKKNIIILNFLILFTSLNAKDIIKKDKSEFLTLDLIERVEPPNWWVGMKTRDLQLLVYGDSISYLQPKIEGGEALLSVQQLEKCARLHLLKVHSQRPCDRHWHAATDGDPA